MKRDEESEKMKKKKSQCKPNTMNMRRKEWKKTTTTATQMKKKKKQSSSREYVRIGHLGSIHFLSKFSVANIFFLQYKTKASKGFWWHRTNRKITTPKKYWRHIIFFQFRSSLDGIFFSFFFNIFCAESNNCFFFRFSSFLLSLFFSFFFIYFRILWFSMCENEVWRRDNGSEAFDLIMNNLHWVRQRKKIILFYYTKKNVFEMEKGLCNKRKKRKKKKHWKINLPCLYASWISQECREME